MKKPKNYIRGKFANAACDFGDVLTSMGIRAAVGYATSRRKKELFAYCERRADMNRVPKEFGEFSVTAVHAGQVRACEDQPPHL